MTRYLSAALGARQPLFSHSIQELERASGQPGADIRLTTELVQRAKLKIGQLGLDPQDTTGPELYSALQGRLAQDDVRLREVLGIAADADPEQIIQAVHTYVEGQEKARCFAIKPVIVKKILKARPPKHAMKRLGYRSIESMLKHEPVPLIMAATLAAEAPAWHRRFQERYATLKPTDFEQGKVVIYYPKTARWTSLATEYTADIHHNVLAFKELGAIVVLPISSRIDGLAITTLLLLLHTINDIQAYSTFAKLQQVKPDFGRIIKHTVTSEPMVAAQLAGQQVPWKLIQRHYGKAQQAHYVGTFEPHVQPEDFIWRDAGSILSALHPALEFWQDTEYTCLLCDGEPVSFNILDVAVGYCNHLPFAQRVVHFVREHMWHELMGRYLHQGNLEAVLHQQLAQELVEPA